LGLSNNNFPKQDLSFLKEATNLEQLTLGNDNREKVQQSIYNKFTDSLDHLSGMEKLKILDISDTDLNEVDINKLPKSLEQINYLIEVRPDCKLTTIASQLEKYGKYGRCLKCWQTNTSYK
jgi:hypothetical protein